VVDFFLTALPSPKVCVVDALTATLRDFLITHITHNAPHHTI
jgi:hypothetical protein